MPDDTEFKPDELAPFLGGWSPYRPNRGRW
jgi:hypothetical protein